MDLGETVMSYESTCFVVMPFGKKPVGDGMIDFDAIFNTVLKPAIQAAVLPEGGALQVRRTDKDFYAGLITLEMFRYLEYSRLAVVDITSLNANVFYELGVRHRARESGTIVLRQPGTALPFDIQSVKAFPYEYQPDENAEKSRQLITRVVTESLKQGALDSPVQLVIEKQQDRPGDMEVLSLQAENLLRNNDKMGAIAIYRRLLERRDATSLDRMKLGFLLKEQELWAEARQVFKAATVADPRYAEAWRELGIAENKAAGRERAADAVGEAELVRAIALNAQDFDAHASLGGVLKRAGRLEEALTHYAAASELSNNHPYPLLNMLKLRARLKGEMALTAADRRALARAEGLRRLQADKDPPYDPPWSQFDMAEIRLLQGDIEGALAYALAGLNAPATAEWQIRTFRGSLAMVENLPTPIPGLQAVVAEIDG